MATINLDGKKHIVSRNKDGQMLIDGQIVSYKGSSIYQTHSGFFDIHDNPIMDFKEKRLSEIVAMIIADNLTSTKKEVG
ncbi:MAG: hypothetical protein PHG82_02275 [Candidatus Gracilibacteria bacterium]|nr:hypothetical protein [Candidatus Gracilibacteria bacterium]